MIFPAASEERSKDRGVMQGEYNSSTGIKQGSQENLCIAVHGRDNSFQIQGTIPLQREGLAGFCDATPLLVIDTPKANSL